MNKTASIIITLALIVGIGIIVIGGSRYNEGQEEMNVSVIDGVQYVTINAKGGYSPKTSNAQAGIPTKLVVKTNNTYDCSSSLVIRSVQFQKVLPPTGEEVIDLGIPQVGTSLQGTCSMGMYSFVVSFG